MFKLAMLGMVEGNAHPYSWSAIMNGYDKEEMNKIAPEFKGIPEYLGNQPPSEFPNTDARVTHIWLDAPYDVQHVVRASLIPHVLARPEDAIGQVDAVIISTDKGYEHVERCRPFVEAGIPIFVDKPLVDNAKDLAIFQNWIKQGKRILSSSCMRYAKEFAPYRLSTNNLGELKYMSITTPKSWERYGIHALEAIYPIIGPGFISARNTGTKERNIVHLKHQNGTDAVVIASQMMYGGFGLLTLAGTKSAATAQFADTFYAFKQQLLAFVSYLKTGVTPIRFEETTELMKLLIAGQVSREEQGREVFLTEINPE